MHDITLRLYRALTAITSLLVLLGIPAMAAGLERVPLPPGYTYPEIPHVDIPDPLFDPPQKGCHGCGGGDGIRLYYEDYAGWRKPLDRYGHKNSTWELLTFEHGFKQAWLGPQFAARLYHHSTDSVRFITRERLVVFEKRTDDNGDISLKCVSDDNWSLRRDGQRVIVESPLRWWAFESPDYGQEWRLVETCMHTFPFPAKLHYDGPHPMLPSALEYPDGKTATIEPAPGTEMVGKITLPNGIVYKIGYDANNFAEFLEEYVPTTEAPKQELENFTIVNQGGEIKQSVTWKKPKTYLKLIHRWSWENDDLGRIHRMINPCGRETKLTFTQHTSDRGDEILTIMTDVTTGNYDYMRHIAKGGTWTLERGHGMDKEPIAEAKFESRIVQESIAHKMVTQRKELSGGDRTVVIENDPTTGEEIGRKVLDARGTLIWQRKKPINKKSPRGSASLPRSPLDRRCDRDCSTTSATYEYHDNGILKSASYQGTTYSYRFYASGHMRCQEDTTARQATEYTYTPRGELKEQKKLQASAPGPGALQLVKSQSYTYYDDGRLRCREYDHAPYQSYSYTCSGIQEVLLHGSYKKSYRFNSENQLRRRATQYYEHTSNISHTRSAVEHFRYRPDGLLKAYRVQNDQWGHEPVTITYHYRTVGQHNLRIIDTMDGPIPPTELNVAVCTLSTMENPQQGYKILSLNRFGAPVWPTDGLEAKGVSQ